MESSSSIVHCDIDDDASEKELEEVFQNDDNTDREMKLYLSLIEKIGK